MLGDFQKYRQDPNLYSNSFLTNTRGTGSRYTEIAKINVTTLEDEDYLVVGTRLKLPRR